MQVAGSEGSALLTTRQLENIAQKGRVLTNYLLLLPGVATNAGTQDAASGSITILFASGLSNTMMTISVGGLQGKDLGSQQLFTTSINPDAVEEIQGGDEQLSGRVRAERRRDGERGDQERRQAVPRVGVLVQAARDVQRELVFNNQRPAQAAVPLQHQGRDHRGPISIPGLFTRDREKLFFFYSNDGNPSTSTPASPARTTLPTLEERRGDFSNSLNPSGALIAVRDPLSGSPFPGNIIPSNHINRHGQTLLGVFTAPNQLNRNITQGAYNNEFLNVVPNVRPGHVFKIDYKATANDSLYFRGVITRFQSIRSSVTEWDFARNSFTARTKSAVFNWTRTLGASMVNEFSVGVRRPQEITRIDDDKGFRKTYKYTAGQLNPAINYNDLLPLATFTGAARRTRRASGTGRRDASHSSRTASCTTSSHRHRQRLPDPAVWKLAVQCGREQSERQPASLHHRAAGQFPAVFGIAGAHQTGGRGGKYRLLCAGFVEGHEEPHARAVRVAYFTPWYGWHGTATSFAPERYNPRNSPPCSSRCWPADSAVRRIR